MNEYIVPGQPPDERDDESQRAEGDRGAEALSKEPSSETRHSRD